MYSKVQNCGFHTISSTLGNWLLATSTADTDTIDNIALLGLVTKTACLVRSGWSRSTVDNVQLSELYCALSANVQRVYSKEHRKDVHFHAHFHVHNIPICPESRFEVLIRFRCRVENPERFELSYLPASNTEKESQHIRLLLLLKFLDVFEGTHCVLIAVTRVSAWVVVEGGC